MIQYVSCDFGVAQHWAPNVTEEYSSCSVTSQRQNIQSSMFEEAILSSLLPVSCRRYQYIMSTTADTHGLLLLINHQFFMIQCQMMFPCIILASVNSLIVCAVIDLVFSKKHMLMYKDLKPISQMAYVPIKINIAKVKLLLPGY